MKYALLGSGKVARHLQFYLESLNLPFVTWSRRSGQALEATLEHSTHVLLAVSDSAISDLVKKVRADQIAVHFSGAAVIPGAFAAHPLMTFGLNLETLDWYKSIPFVIDEGISLKTILPGLENPSYQMAPEKRAFYHALCSLAGNSTFLLWKKIGDEFESKLNLPRELLAPFLHQVVRNALSESAAQNFTGPVAREDWNTVHAHLNALTQQPQLLEAYKHFIRQAAFSGLVHEAFL